MIFIGSKHEKKRLKFYFDLAAKEARKSTCKKSQRGAIIVKNNSVISRGYNKVTLEELCNPCIREKIQNNSQVELCSAIHAEQMAILNVFPYERKHLRGSTMYHVKLKNGVIQPSGKPSCTVCSRILYEAGIEFVLWHKEGYALYSPDELNKLSFEYFLKRRL